ncbi:MAG TPA: LacI family DNA-binding transcriptional regulator, partial [Phototrophicaceae bacterium]|nr:LacI family DNA-binding transcriptional regulator [Phototrophicaceae bacterium]
MQIQAKPSEQVTIYDVAREAGVSDATVSRVFNNKDNVRESTRDRVLIAAKKLGYVANQQARILAGGKSNIMGLLVPGLDTAYVAEIVRGIDVELSHSNYEMMVYTTRRRGGDEASYLQYIANGLSAGLLLVVPLLSPDYLKTLSNLKYPYVLIDEIDETDNSFSVVATNRQGGYDATRYLIELGHRRIAFIKGISDLHSSASRLDGYLSALEDCHVPVHQEYIVNGDFMQSSGYNQTQSLLALPEPPTAIFAANDVMALGAMDAIRIRGLEIPGDISLIGFDDIPQAFTTHPKLTTVRQPLEEMG